MQFANYGFENLKWRIILPDLSKFSFLKTQKAVYAGNAVGILTPDRLGTFIGRFTYLTEVSKTRITYSTFVGNYAQLVTTILFALIGATLSWNLSINFHFPEKLSLPSILLVLIPLSCIALFGLYHQITIVKIIGKIKSPRVRSFIDKLRFMHQLNESRVHLLLLFSIARYLIFVLQFHLSLKIFGSQESFLWTLSFCGLVYLFATIIPSPFMGNLGTREAIAVFLVASIGIEEIVVVSSLLIWLINIVFPSILGGLILLRKK